MGTQTATMTTKEVANRLVKLCREGKIEEAQKELFADDVVSIEAQVMPGQEKEAKGIDAIFEKGRQFMSMVEGVHGSEISEPIVLGNLFAITWSFDATMKGRGRNKMEEVCVYKVKDGKVVSEQFIS